MASPGFKRFDDALEISQRRHRHAIDARDYFAGNDFIRPDVGGQSVRIDFLHIKSFHAGQMFLSNLLRREFSQRQTDAPTAGLGAFRLFFGAVYFHVARQGRAVQPALH